MEFELSKTFFIVSYSLTYYKDMYLKRNPHRLGRVKFVDE